MSRARVLTGELLDRSELPRGPNGRALCRWCAIEVPRGRMTFCSDWCVHEWRLRSNPGYLRDQVFKRDRGVCAVCKLDTIETLLRLKRARGERRRELMDKFGAFSVRRSLWEADHILPVAEGGGECDLQNMRTLCLSCHKRATRELRERLRARAAEPKT